MVLDLDREPFFAGVEAWAAGDRPALHDPVEFEPKVVVQPPRGMLLDHVATAARPFATELRRGARPRGSGVTPNCRFLR